MPMMLVALHSVLHRRTYLNQSNWRSKVQLYFPLKCYLTDGIKNAWLSYL